MDEGVQLRMSSALLARACSCLDAPLVSSIRARQSSSLLSDPMANTSVALKPPSREKDHLSCRFAILPGRHLHLEIDNTLTKMMNRTLQNLHVLLETMCKKTHLRNAFIYI